MDFSKLAGMFGNSAALNDLFGDLEQTLAEIQVTGEAAGGQVSVTLNGRRDAIGVHVDSGLLAQENQQIVENFIVGAINDAERKLDGILQEKQREYLMKNLGKLSTLIRPS